MPIKMFISNKHIKLYIDEDYISYSPYLSLLLNTNVPVEMYDGAYLVEGSDEDLEAYANFLQGKDFNMNEDTEVFFDFMGHENRMEYPLDFWKIKLQDNWIRDNMYKFRLYEDPYYDLIKLPIKNRINIDEYLHEGTIIAGGAALYMAGYSDTYSDIDIFFTCNQQRAEEILQEVQKYNDDLYQGTHTVLFKEKIGSDQNKKISYILRLYKAPTEVIHGFDLDCVGILYDPFYENEDGTKGALFATKRCLYSIQNKENWFDPDRVSPSYAYRLSKYNVRGFELMLPFINDELGEGLSRKAERYLYDKLQICIRHWIYHHTPDDRASIIDFLSSTFKIDILSFKDCKNILEKQNRLARIFELLMSDMNMDLDRGDIFVIQYQLKGINLPDNSMAMVFRLAVEGFREYNDQRRYRGEKPHKDVLPRDPASILILSKVYKLTSNYWKQSDYKGKQDLSGFDFDISKINWITQDPMQQLSSTIYPTKIDDLQEWYKTSPLYN